MIRQQTPRGRGRGRGGRNPNHSKANNGGRGGRSGRGGRGKNNYKKTSSPQQTTLFSHQAHTQTHSSKSSDNTRLQQPPSQDKTDRNQSTLSPSKDSNGNNEVVVLEEEFDNEEDEVNTITSDETSKRGRATQNKKVAPKFTRYQLMIKMNDTNKDSPIQIESTEEEKSPTQRVRDILASFYSQMRQYDSKSRLISWKARPDFSQLGDEFPQDIAEVAMYFNGFRANMNTDKRIYLRLCLHTPNSETKLYQKLSSWCRLYGYSITKCVIQAEKSTYIGWLCYSSQYTDTEPLRERLMDASDFEWGFKLVSVDDSQSKLPWMKRLKAIGVYVPTEVKDIALQVIGEELEAELNEPISIPDFTDKFLFIEPQWTTKGNKSREMYYEGMLDRHISHME